LRKPFGQHEVEQGRVLYLAGENPDDVRMRWIAMGEKLGFNINTIPVHFIPGTFKISKMESRIKAEIEKIGPFALIIIDTSNAYFEGTDLNDNVQMGVHARRLRGLVKLPGQPTVLVACHPVKNPDMSNILPMGGGAFLNEMDGNPVLIKDDTSVTMKWHGKFRGPDFAPIVLQLSQATSEKLKDSKGRKIPTVLAKSMSEPEQAEAAATTREDEDSLLVAIADNPRASQAALARVLGWISDKGENKAKVNRLAKRLKKSKHLTDDRGSLVLTDKGSDEVKRIRSNRELAGSTY
jgi:hypothetical protein